MAMMIFEHLHDCSINLTDLPRVYYTRDYIQKMHKDITFKETWL